MSFLKRTFPLSYFFHNYNVLAKFQIEMSRKSFTALFCINQDTKAIQLESSHKKRIAFYFIFLLHTFWVAVTFLNIFSRVFGSQETGNTKDEEEDSSYPIQQKVIDVSWLTFAFGKYALQLEYFRIQDEVPLLLNQIFLLENKAMEKGG